MTGAIEHRAFVDVRNEGRGLTGYAATFGTETRINGAVEVIRPGAFSGMRSDILALVDHDQGKVLGRTSSGTLRLTQDEQGLRFDLDIPDTSLGRDILVLAERGDLGGMSFGFIPVDAPWVGKRRELRAVDLREISVVHSWPAYPATSVNARSLTPQLNRLKRFLETV